MTIIDEDGNLFGVVNLIDALAVVLLLAVLVAGIGFVGVLGPDESDGTGEGDPTENGSEIRYTTVELGQLPPSVVDNLSEGDNISSEETSTSLTITDVYITPDGDQSDEPHTTVRTEVTDIVGVDGTNSQPTAQQLRVGAELQLDLGNYSANGSITNVGSEGSKLAVEETAVLLESTVSSRTASELEANDTVSFGSHTTATVTQVDLYPVDGEQYRAMVGIELSTLTQGSTPNYADTPVTVGSTLSLQPSTYELEGELVQRGSDKQAGDLETTTATIELKNVSTHVADSVHPGMDETIRGETHATINSVESEPAEVVLESDDGDIYLREHPTNEDVTLDVELRALETDTQVRFHGKPLREGDSVTLEFEQVIVDGMVTNY